MLFYKNVLLGKKKMKKKSKGWKVAFEWTKEKIGCQG